MDMRRQIGVITRQRWKIGMAKQKLLESERPYQWVIMWGHNGPESCFVRHLSILHQDCSRKQKFTEKAKHYQEIIFFSPACSYYQNQEMVFLIIALIVKKYRSDTLYGAFNAMSLKAALDRMEKKKQNMKPKVMISVRTGRPESAECIQPILCSGILINLKNGLEGIDRSEKSRPTLKCCEKNGQPVSFQRWSWLMTDWWLRRKTELEVSTSN